MSILHSHRDHSIQVNRVRVRVGTYTYIFIYIYNNIAQLELCILIKNGGRIKAEGKTPRTSKNTSQRRKTQGPGKGLEEAKNRSAPHPGERVWEGLQTKEC